MLAERLSMTVGRLREEIGAGEFLLWSRHLARQAQREELERKRAR